MASVFANGNTIISSWQSEFSDKQGNNNFYFYESQGGQLLDMIYDDAKKTWHSSKGTHPLFGAQFASPGAASDTNLTFLSPVRGTVRLQGKAMRNQAYIGGAVFGDGVNLSILKNNRTIWNGSIASDSASAEYDLTLSVKVGDKIHFRINAGFNNAYDSTEWWPSVDYVSSNYVVDEYDPIYYQKSGDIVTELEYNESNGLYVASDNIALISDSSVMPSDSYSVIKQFNISETGRYRVYAAMTSNSTLSNGNILTVHKNGIEVWKQLCVGGETDILDIGIYAQKNDKIDVEVGVNEYSGFNHCTWVCDVTKYLGKLFKECDTSSGPSYSVIKEFALSSFVKKTQENGVTYSSEKYGVKHPMVYNNVNNRWDSGLSGEKDYISDTEISPGITTNAVLDILLKEDGILKIDGPLIVNSQSDGVLSKIYLNDKVVWSNRVGSERSLRWDDPFDEVYFLNNINVIINVNSGDKLSFSFNKWRNDTQDIVDISKVKLQYISGNILSKTTKWKLANSVVVDTVEGTVHTDGICDNVDVKLINGITYIAKSDLKKIFKENTKEIEELYAEATIVPLRDAAELAKKSVFWAADRMVMIYNNPSIFYGYPENGEIKVQIELGRDLFE